MDIEYPVKCPLLGNQLVEMDVCFDIHMVVCGEAPRYTAPREIYEHEDFENICERCQYHRDD